MNQQTEAKQKYLRDEILNAGMDPTQFLVYLTTINPKKGDRLQLWSLQDLQAIVKVYKLSKAPPTLVMFDQNKPPAASEQQKAKAQLTAQDDLTYYESVPCLKKQPSKISSYSDLQLRITNFSKNQGGMFERAYIQYTIQIPTLKTCVNRRYSDFVWLRDTLILLYPGYPIPPIKKKGKIKRYDDKYLIKKMLILQKFLNTLLIIPELFTEPLLERFVTISDPREFQKLKVQYNKLQKLPLAKVKTISGTINIGTDKQISNKVKKYQEYLRATQPQIKKIYKNFKGAATCLEQANEYFQSVSNSCSFLRSREEAFRLQLEFPSIINNSPLAMLENLTRLYGVQLQEQARSFRRDIYSLMKYESLYRLNMLESMEQLSKKQEEYFQAKASLARKKERLYAQGRMDRWGLQVKVAAKPQKEEAVKIMLPKQSKQVLQLRESYAVANIQIYEQCTRHTKYNNKVLSQYIHQFIQTQVSNATRTAEIFRQLSERNLLIKSFYLSHLKQ